MTFYTCLKILYGDMYSLNINPMKTYLRASEKASRMSGTTAHL